MNLWGNAREGSDLPSQLQSQAEVSTGLAPVGDAVVLSDVTHSYRTRRGERVKALAGVSLRAAHGELLAVVGPSGCGKTTLLELICRLQSPERGTLECPSAALMPQRDLLLPWLSAVDNAALALRIAGHSRTDAREGAAKLFAEFGLDGFQQARPAELSGGMRQRVAFLRTLLSGKELLCLDEPFGALDAITRGEMQDWLAVTLGDAPRTIVLVTHDVEEAIVLADRVLVLSPRPGRVIDELDVDIPRPRARTDAEVMLLREHVLGVLAPARSAEPGR